MSTGFSTDAIIVISFLAFLSAVLLVLVVIIARWLWQIGDFEKRRRHDARVARRRSREERDNSGRQGEAELTDAEALVPVAGDVTAFGGDALTSVCVGSDVPLPAARHAMSVPGIARVAPPGAVLEPAVGAASNTLPVLTVRQATLLHEVPVATQLPSVVPSRSSAGGAPLMSPSPAWLAATTGASNSVLPPPTVALAATVQHLPPPSPPRAASEGTEPKRHQPPAPLPQNVSAGRGPVEEAVPASQPSPRDGGGTHQRGAVSPAEVDRELYSPVEGGSPEENPRSPPVAMRMLSPVLSPSAPATIRVTSGIPEQVAQPVAMPERQPTPNAGTPQRADNSDSGPVAAPRVVLEPGMPTTTTTTTTTHSAEEPKDKGDNTEAGRDDQQRESLPQEQQRPRACKFCGMDLRDSAVLRADCTAAAGALRALALSSGDGAASSEPDVSYSHQKISATIRRVKKEKKVIKELLTEGRVAEGQARLEILQRDFRGYV